MTVFISWSGERSKAVAELLSEWIECVIQAVEPWISSRDIDRGSLWFSEINQQLANVTVGIICLTSDNKDKPWILFEAGALAKGLSTSRVCTFLIDLNSQDLENPLAQFNHTLPSYDGVWQLVRTINNTLGENKLKENVLANVYEAYWPTFAEKFNEIMINVPANTMPVKRDEESILSEILNSVRSMDKRLSKVEADNSLALWKGILEKKEDYSKSRNKSVWNKIITDQKSGTVDYDDLEGTNLSQLGLSAKEVLEIKKRKYDDL